MLKFNEILFNSKEGRSELFHLVELQKCCSDLKVELGQILWDILVLEEHLPVHLTALRDIFLSGKGEFMAELIGDIDRLVRKSHSSLVTM